MKKLQLVLMSACVSVSLVLTGCTTTPKDQSAQLAANNQAGSAAENDAAQSYGMNGQNQFQGENLADNAQTNLATKDLTVYFDFDSNSIAQKYADALTAEANYLLAHPNAHVRLAGNTDVRGSREYNIALGWRRAQVVAQFLEQHGVSAKQLAMVSYGKERPATYGSTDADYALNRRTNMVFESR